MKKEPQSENTVETQNARIPQTDFRFARDVAGGHSISLQQWKRIGLATGTERCRAYIYEMEATP
jgi:hypothetical protein